jgi:hypothetical protein
MGGPKAHKNSKFPVELQDRPKSLSARSTLDTLKVDAPHLGWRNQLSTLEARRIELTSSN